MVKAFLLLNAHGLPSSVRFFHQVIVDGGVHDAEGYEEARVETIRDQSAQKKLSVQIESTTAAACANLHESEDVTEADEDEADDTEDANVRVDSVDHSSVVAEFLDVFPHVFALFVDNLFCDLALDTALDEEEQL